MSAQCALYPPKRTLRASSVMSATCQKRTWSCGAWDPRIDFISQQREINRFGQ